MKQSVAVLGAGLMGHGIAYLIARAGRDVRVQDPSAASLESLPSRLERICSLLGSDGETVGARVRREQGIEAAVKNVTLVIEAAPEILSLKQQIFGELERCADGNTLLAGNTSVIPIAAISEQLTRRERICAKPGNTRLSAISSQKIEGELPVSVCGISG